MKKLSKEAQMMLGLIYSLPLGSGARVSFEEITMQTGIKMTKHGKDMLYRMLHKAGRHWNSIRGEGIELSGIDNATEMVKINIDRMDRTITKTHSVISEVISYVPRLSRSDQEFLFRASSTVGAMMIAKRIIPFQPPNPNNSSPPILPLRWEN